MEKELRSDDLLKEYGSVLKELEVIRRKEKGTLEEKMQYLKQAAEITFAIAMESIENGDLGKAAVYAEKSINLYKELNVGKVVNNDPYYKAVPYYRRVNNVEIPDLMHENVVKERFNLKANRH